MKYIILVSMALLILIVCTQEKKNPIEDSLNIELLINKKCTEWKSLCVGDTVLHVFKEDSVTCIITKIVFRRNCLGDLIGARTLDGSRHLGADESWFNPKGEKK